MRREKRKPVSTETIAAVGLSAAAIAVFVLFIALSAGSGGNTPALLGGLSIFALIAAIAAFVMGFRARKNENFDRLFSDTGCGSAADRGTSVGRALFTWHVSGVGAPMGQTEFPGIRK